MNKKIGKRVEHLKKLTDRIIEVRIKLKPKPTTIVKVGMPTSTLNDDKVEGIYEEIKHIKVEENIIIVGDWNASIGKGKKGNIVGDTYWERNERGNRHIE